MEKDIDLTATNHIIHWETCLDLAAGRSALAKSLLADFIADLPTAKADIDVANRQNNRKQLRSLIHRLFGSCCYCSVPQLKKSVAAIEVLLKENINAPLNNLMETLYAEIDAVIAVYQTNKNTIEAL